MAEAVVSFGLAANVLQFLEFGSKFVNNLWSIYKGYKDGPQNSEIENLTKTFQDVVKDLQREDQLRDQPEPNIRKLADGCSKVATEFLTLLTSLTSKMQVNSKTSVFKTALKTMWKEDDIIRYQRQIDVFRSQLMLNLITNLRTQVRKSEDQQVLILNGINNILRSTRTIQGQVEQRTAGSGELGPTVIELIVSKLAQEDRSQEREQLERNAIDQLLSLDDDNSLPEKPTITSQRFQQITRRILVRLHFNAIQDRVDNIADAHQKTFKWIFDDHDEHSPQTWASLSQWLSSSTQLYWVTGKPGSGKSTLMKYIAYPSAAETESPSVLHQKSDSATKEVHTPPTWQLTRSGPYLSQWAPAPLKLIVASYFSGTRAFLYK